MHSLQEEIMRCVERIRNEYLQMERERLADISAEILDLNSRLEDQVELRLLENELARKFEIWEIMIASNSECEKQLLDLEERAAKKIEEFLSRIELALRENQGSLQKESVEDFARLFEVLPSAIWSLDPEQAKELLKNRFDKGISEVKVKLRDTLSRLTSNQSLLADESRRAEARNIANELEVKEKERKMLLDALKGFAVSEAVIQFRVDPDNPAGHMAEANRIRADIRFELAHGLRNPWEDWNE